MIYETEHDIAKELKCGKAAQKIWGGEMIKTPKMSALDFFHIREGNLVAMIEVKIRELKPHFETIWFPLSKAIEADGYKRWGIPTRFIVGLVGKKPSESIWIDVGDHIPESITWGGRNSRDEDEALVHFRRDDFNEL